MSTSKTIHPRDRRPSRLRSAWRALLSVMAAASTLWLVLGQALAAGGKPAHKLVNVADTRLMDGGFGKWVADIYNHSYWLYGALVVVIMAGMGLILGIGSDRLISALGINLGKLDHHE